MTHPRASCRGHKEDSQAHPLAASQGHTDKKSLPQGHLGHHPHPRAFGWFHPEGSGGKRYHKMEFLKNPLSTIISEQSWV